MNLYLSPKGRDQWSGRLSAPNRTKTDGPLATPAAALALLRKLKDKGDLDGPATVWLRDGIYPLAEPLRFAAEDSWPVTFAAYRNERPIFDGGRRITDWRITKIHGRPAWVATLPDVARGEWSFRELFVNGRRAPRPRLPRPENPDAPLSLKPSFRMAQVPGMKLPTGWAQGAGGQTQFVCAEGDVRAFRNLTDVEVVFLHFWIEERSPIAAFDPVTRLVTMARPSRGPMVASHGSTLADYYLDNVYEALDTPGQWYLDRPTGRLIYLPRPGEHPDRTEVWAPRLLQLAALIGDPAAGRFVEHIRFRGLTFRHTDWRHPGEETNGLDPDTGAAFSRQHDASTSQAASDVPGVIRFHGARHCAVEDCTIEHAGWYGVEIGDGCRAIRVVGNTLRDLGAGGVRINGAAARERCPARETSHHRVTDNTITQAGRIFHSAVGILAMHGHDLILSHNHIHDLYYTGISCGWEWGYQESASYNNRIEANHIHDIGQGLLSDMGGIYTLGVQPGTVIRGNRIHDIRSAHYGGWCIYPDEGSSHILIENNVCHDADRQAFHQHYGRENVVRNNVFAFGGISVATYTRLEPHRGFTFERNILITDGKPIWSSHHLPDTDAPRFLCDLNLIWDVRGRPPVFAFKNGKSLTLAAWRKLGRDIHSRIADPLCRNIKTRDFTLARNSLALGLGFQPIDLSGVGPRSAKERRR